MADGTHDFAATSSVREKRIQECVASGSADDCTTATTNMTEMAPIRRHTTSLVHPFHHHRPHSCNCPVPIHFMLRCGLFITKKHIDLERSFLGEEEASKHPLHLSSFCAMRESASRWSPSIQFFSRRHGAPVSLPVTPERPITTIGLSICLSTADNCQTSCRAQPPESQLSWSGPNMVATWSCLCQFCLSLDISICHRAFRTFHPFPKTARVNFFSYQPTATPSNVVSDIHYRRARVTFEVGTSFFCNPNVIHQILFWCVPTQVTTVAAKDIVNLAHCATTSCSSLAPTPHFVCNHLVHAASIPHFLARN